jgi:hypothetical protein
MPSSAAFGPPLAQRPNYARGPLASQFKGDPRKVDQEEKRAKEETADKKGKQQVRDRDKGICRVCGRKATEVHEALTFKSRGGVASLQNSIHVCAEPSGKCHQLLQQRGIRVIGKHCSRKLVFEMSRKVAKLVFGRQPIPKHVRITREAKPCAAS